ncbi:MAG TPA: papain-like cysteine protease family protein [Pyrinomonadaceae bacterium]|nr:papain-like cysteine protease family protein [Pyrinomonadaceae bacterium]
MVAKQKTGVWCWAACAEIVNAYYGRKVPQETIVERIQGRAAADPEAAQMAKRQEVLAALDTELYQRLKDKDAKEKAWLRQKLLDPLHGLHITVSTAKEFPREPDLKFNPDQLMEDLKHQSPVVLGLGVRTEDDSGHIVVIYGADAVEKERDGFDKIKDGFKTFDPFKPKSAQKRAPEVKYTIKKVYCADPDGGKTTEVTAAELERRADFLATREGAREYIQYLDKVDHYIKVQAR